MWAGTEGGGLDQLDPSTGVFRHFRHDPADPTSLAGDRVYSLFEDEEGVLWVGTAKGGLSRFDRSTSTFTRYRSGDGSNLAPGFVRSIFQDRDGVLMVGTDGGLNVWDRETRRFSVYRHDDADVYSLSHSRVDAIYQDRGGVIWLGTPYGLNKWNPATGSFPHFAPRPDDPTQLAAGYVTSFAEGPSSEVWVGTIAGLHRFDPHRKSFERFAHDASDPGSVAENRVGSLTVDRDGAVWVGTINRGVDRLDPETGRFEHFSHRPDDPSSLSHNGVTAILQDRRDTIWVGTYRGGLNRFVPETGEFVRYRHDPQDPTSLGSDRVVALLEDRDGNLLVGTDGGGISRLDRERLVFTRFRHAAERADSLSSDHVWALTEGPEGGLWVGTQGGGLNQWADYRTNPDRPSFRRFFKQDGLQSTTIYGILPDRRGHIWLSTNRGLAVLDPETGSFRNYNASHGLQSEEFNSGAALLTRDGHMYFGGINGFNAFDPADIRTNQHVPPVVVTKFLRFNQEVLFDRPLDELREIELSHRDTVIGFEVSALDYTDPEKNRYRYRLEGFDQEWVDLAAGQRITYTNLDPGLYTLRVLGANNDGLWNEEGIALTLRASPPPWATGRAYSIYALLAVCAATVFVRDQRSRQHRARALERANRDLQLEIGERQRAEGELRKLSLAVEQSPASVIITDRDGRIDYVNPNFVKVTGYSPEEVAGRSLELLHSGYDSGAQLADLWRSVRAGRTWRGEVHSRRKNGELFWEEASISPIIGADGEITHLLVVNEDLTARKQYEMRLLRQAHYDHLTGLPNRTLALDRLSRALARNNDQGKLVAVMFLDLDNFKIVNDTMGHAAGDQLLKASANRLLHTIRESDTVARLGGDEFLFVIGNLDALVDVENAARRVLDCFAEPLSIQGREIFVTASLGITIAPSDSIEPQVLLRNADAAMYRAKATGRDAYQFFTPAMNEHAVARLQLESNLRQALARRELRLEFQPLVDTDDEQIVGAEALLRWRNPHLGRVSPQDFIPVAEDTGLIVPIGEWVLESACRQAKNWSQLHGRALRVAVNISARQLRPDAGLVDAVRSALERSGLPASSLELEVTEGVLLDDHATAATILGRLHYMGVRLAIDDFGTGYSSLRYLREFPFDVLKIDRSFVQDLDGLDDNSPLLRAIIAMAGGLELEVVGEGVETAGQLAALRRMGCRLVQGYLYKRPLPARELARLLARGGKIEPGEDAPESETTPVFRPRLLVGGLDP